MIRNFIPQIAIGTWALGGDYYGKQSHRDSLKTIHSAIREGFIFYDTAPVYGKGTSEQVLGQQLKNNHNFLISTKSFIKPVNSVKKSIQQSLTRLNREYIDFFFIHWPSTKIDIEPMFNLLLEYKEQGKIRNIGLSNFNKDELDHVLSFGDVDIVQNAFNFFWTKEKEYLIYCKDKGITTQIYSPLAQGLLTSKFNKNHPYSNNDKRFKMILFNSSNIDTVYYYIDCLTSIAKKEQTTLYNLVLSWTLNIDYIDSIIVGCRKRYQIEDLKQSLNYKISSKTISDLDSLAIEISNKIIGDNNIFNHFY